MAEDFDQIRSAMEKCPPYQTIFSRVRCWCGGSSCLFLPLELSFAPPYQTVFSRVTPGLGRRLWGL